MNIPLCCRTCMSEKSLNPIFNNAELEEKYASVFNVITGLSISIADKIPNKICTECVNFINKCIEFRQKCTKSEKILLERLSYGVTYDNETDGRTDFEFININSQGVKKENYSDDCIDNFEAYVNVLEKVSEKKINNKKNGKTTYVKNEDCEDIKKIDSSDNDKKNNIECNICHKLIKGKGFAKHYKTHTGFDFVCEHCGKKFSCRRKLLYHCKAKHGYEKTDKCSFCNYTACNIEQIRIHERLHTGEKPYTCKDCGAKFHRNSNYLQHLPVHLAEKTVQCDQCPAMFKSISFMRIHKSRLHGVSKYQYKCGLCKNTFARRYNVVKHLRRIHNLAAKDEAKHIERINIL